MTKHKCSVSVIKHCDSSERRALPGHSGRSAFLHIPLMHSPHKADEGSNPSVPTQAAEMLLINTIKGGSKKW